MESSILSIDAQGAGLHKTGQRLQIRLPDGTIKQEIPLFRIKEIFLLGNIQISNFMLRHILNKGPWTTFLTLKGKYKGAIGPCLSPRSVLRLKQYKISRKLTYSIPLVKELLHFKISTELHQLKKWARRQKNLIASSISGLKTIKEQIEMVETPDELRGLEGYSSKFYFQAFSQMLAKNWDFTQRNRRPPKDPVNAMLSLGYTFLFSEFISEICKIGLDPYLGFFHVPKNLKASLALDLMEPFRVEIDEMVLKSLNLGRFNRDSFEFHQNGACFLGKGNFPKFSLIFGQTLDTKWNYSGNALKVREGIKKLVKNYKIYINNHGDKNKLKALAEIT